MAPTRVDAESARGLVGGPDGPLGGNVADASPRVGGVCYFGECRRSRLLGKEALPLLREPQLCLCIGGEGVGGAHHEDLRGYRLSRALATLSRRRRCLSHWCLTLDADDRRRRRFSQLLCRSPLGALARSALAERAVGR